MKHKAMEIEVKGRAGMVEVRPIGDAHIGKRNCSETLLRKEVSRIAENDNCYWFGGGDLIDCIKPQDIKRFDPDIFPDWMFEGDADSIRDRLSDIVQQQVDRAVEIFKPIAHQCIGLIEGNHEFTNRKFYNHNVQKALCQRLGVENLTDQFILRMVFHLAKSSSVCLFLYARHGYGSGRSAGAEPNKVKNMMTEWPSPDILLTGHTHTPYIAEPQAVLYLPTRGRLPKESLVRYRYGANWGSWLYTGMAGASSYESRACYPPRPMVTNRICITPFRRTWKDKQEFVTPQIEIRRIELK